MRTSKNGALARLALLIGLSGMILSGCGVGTVDPVVPPECIPSDLDPACDDGDPSADNVVPRASATG
ncbi:MAG: hypothetical protein R3195_08295 [Gemmatimonadota bacterium]|nr:hypothetical protein [Gemmatimonadota bacterium]